jgi:hypothetical protein
MTVYIVIVHSSFYSDNIPHIHKVFSDEEKAYNCKKDYEYLMLEHKGMALPILDKHSTDDDYDLYNTIDMANKFICCTIENYLIQN